MSDNRTITRTALLLALTLIFQSLRFFIPLPPFLSTFLIGSLVNASLLIATEKIGLWSALVIAVVTPVVAYFQQLLPLPVFIIPVALGNTAYVCLFLFAGRQRPALRVALATLGKSGLLYVLFAWLLTFIAISPKLAAGIMLAMSWPQLVTGAIGGFIAFLITKRI
ncbi:ECF transporter S component [Sporomusa acidovorans]|uniref:Uncharacterized protein n=2 Tax=Sporomusa TaxID=2375 RepID=A0ABZ3J3V7_SPOA4|nr:ECF transporter S component [Sporomusa acidovorans]OZC15474.1 hypothetical protein SPACI_47780 [Sporomusa acidovorans DSM 3132]SDE15663.1 hypothetical protein SAMN04488499_10094 [Sporomusa acidovorans]